MVPIKPIYLQAYIRSTIVFECSTKKKSLMVGKRRGRGDPPVNDRFAVHQSVLFGVADGFHGVLFGVFRIVIDSDYIGLPHLFRHQRISMKF